MGCAKCGAPTFGRLCAGCKGERLRPTPQVDRALRAADAPNPHTMLDVVSAAILRQDHRTQGYRVLLAQRAPTSTYPWALVTPGGKVDEVSDGGVVRKETHHTALMRELDEEVGLKRFTDEGVEVLTPHSHPVLYVHHGKVAGYGPFRLTCYAMHLAAGVEPTPNPRQGVVGLVWYGVDELRTTLLGPADAAHRELLIALVRGTLDG